MKISIIIPTFKREMILQQTIRAAVEAVGGLDAEIIVVNDGPKYDIELPKQINLYSNPKKGVSSARNYGFSKATGEVIIFLDNDILLTHEALLHFQKLINQYPQAIFNPNWKYPSELIDAMHSNQFGRFLLKTGNYNYKAWSKSLAWGTGPLIEANELATFCLIMKREVFDQAGQFDEDMHFGEEDLELTRRAKNKGYDLYVDESVYVYHNESDRVTLSNKLNRMKIVGAMLRQNQDFMYSSLKKSILKMQSKVNFILFWCIKMIPNVTFFDFVYSFFAHRLLADAIYRGYLAGNQNESIAHTYSKLK